MLRLLRAGVVASGCQLGSVVIVTLLAHFSVSHGINLQSTPATTDSESFWISITPFLIWAYLLTAVGWALTGGQFIERTVDHFRSTFSPRDEALTALVVQLVIPAILLVTLALESPPDFIVEAAGYFGYAAIASVVWGAAISIAVAFCGATAHAARKARKRPN
jgi:hypothetical protein